MKNTAGHVYVLISPICEYILIGGTDAAPFKRIREVNARGPYKVLGPWSLYDIRQVADWRRVERSLHSTFRSKLVKSIRGQKELFATSPTEVSRKLEQLDAAQVLEKPKIDRMLQDAVFARFLGRLFRSSAILKWLNMQVGMRQPASGWPLDFHSFISWL
jgi:hypothetical protein